MSSLFGNKGSQSKSRSSGGGLFGKKPAGDDAQGQNDASPPTTAKRGLFGGSGNQNNQPASGGGLFGGGNKQPSEDSSSPEQKPVPSGGLFGGGSKQPSESSSPKSKSASQGGLFGGGSKRSESPEKQEETKQDAPASPQKDGANSASDGNKPEEKKEDQQEQKPQPKKIFGGGGGLFANKGQSNNSQEGQQQSPTAQPNFGGGGGLFKNRPEPNTQEEQPQEQSLFSGSGGLFKNPDEQNATSPKKSEEPGPLANIKAQTQSAGLTELPAMLKGELKKEEAKNVAESTRPQKSSTKRGFNYELNKLKLVQEVVSLFEDWEISYPEGLLDESDFAEEFVGLLESYNIEIPSKPKANLKIVEVAKDQKSQPYSHHPPPYGYHYPPPYPGYPPYYPPHQASEPVKEDETVASSQPKPKVSLPENKKRGAQKHQPEEQKSQAPEEKPTLTIQLNQSSQPVAKKDAKSESNKSEEKDDDAAGQESQPEKKTSEPPSRGIFGKKEVSNDSSQQKSPTKAEEPQPATTGMFKRTTLATTQNSGDTGFKSGGLFKGGNQAPSSTNNTNQQTFGSGGGGIFNKKPQSDEQPLATKPASGGGGLFGNKGASSSGGGGLFGNKGATGGGGGGGGLFNKGSQPATGGGGGFFGGKGAGATAEPKGKEADDAQYPEAKPFISEEELLELLKAKSEPQTIKEKYDDDDDLAKTCTDELFDFEHKIAISTKSNALKKNTDSQNVPLVIDYAVDKKNNADSFQPSDIVLMIDTSGSMRDGKLDMVKTNVKKFVQTLSENDRLAIVAFGDEGKRLCGLTRNNAKKIEDALEELKADGITNIDHALKHSFEILAQRKKANPVSSIIILTDGLDFSGKDYYESFKAYYPKIKSNFLIQTIGLGDQHDPFICIPVAGMAQGEYYPCTKFEEIDQALKLALNDLRNVVGKNPRFNLELSKPVGSEDGFELAIAQKIGGDDMWKESKDDDDSSLLLCTKAAYIIAGKHYSFGVELTVKLNSQSIELPQVLIGKAKINVESLVASKNADNFEMIRLAYNEPENKALVSGQILRKMAENDLVEAAETALCYNFTDSKAIVEKLAQKCEAFEHKDHEANKQFVDDILNIKENWDHFKFYEVARYLIAKYIRKDYTLEHAN